MRLKVFTAPTLAQAMAKIRDELGPDAVIVSTEHGGRGGARVLAAIEDADPVDSAQPVAHSLAPAPPKPQGIPLDRLLRFHGVPDHLAGRLADRAAAGAAPEAISGALRGVFRFANLAEKVNARPILLAGPPGVGKTLTAAKLAARAVMAGSGVRVITTDVARAGGIEQLGAFTRVLGIELEVAETPAQLEDLLMVGRAGAADDVVPIVDTAGANPFAAAEVAAVAELVAAARAEPVLVLASGGNTDESAEIAEAFAAIGCTRLIPTRIDAARRLGSVLAAADAGRLAFAEASSTPQVAHGLMRLDPPALARLLCAVDIAAAASREKVS